MLQVFKDILQNENKAWGSMYRLMPIVDAVDFEARSDSDTPV